MDLFSTEISHRGCEISSNSPSTLLVVSVNYFPCVHGGQPREAKLYRACFNVIDAELMGGELAFPQVGGARKSLSKALKNTKLR